MKIFYDQNKIFQEIKKMLNKQTINIISVDGINSSGKTTLAKSISEEFKIPHINIDDNFLIKKKGGFIEFIKYEELLLNIEKVLNSSKILIIDSICILEILERVKFQPDLKIYVKRLIAGDYWFDGEKIDYSKSVDEIIKSDKLEIAKFISFLNNSNSISNNSDDHEYIFHEILQYHFKFKPDLKSDLTFQRKDYD